MVARLAHGGALRDMVGQARDQKATMSSGERLHGRLLMLGCQSWALNGVVHALASFLAHALVFKRARVLMGTKDICGSMLLRKQTLWLGGDTN
jgi:hypothetical protein